jgi:transposase
MPRAVLEMDTQEKADLIALARTTKDLKTGIRIRVIIAIAEGNSATHVAKLFLLDENTVVEWKKKYIKRRLFSDWLSFAQIGYQGKLDDNQLRELDAFIESQTFTGAASVAAHIKYKYNVEYTVDGVTKLLHRLGFVFKQTTLVPGKLDELAQAKFKEEYQKLRDSLPSDEVMLFADGVHPSHNVTSTRAWIKRGKQKQIPTNTGRTRLNINGVLDIKAMEAMTHFSKTINTETTIEFLDKIQLAYPAMKTIHIILDNARYYKNKAMAAYLTEQDCRIKFIFLPPYSPNLNLIERLWRFMIKNIIGQKRRQKFKDFENDIKQFFENFKNYESELRQFIGTEMHLIKLQN